MSGLSLLPAILCDILGRDMEAGLLPDDLGLVGGLAADVSYRNAKRYFGFGRA